MRLQESTISMLLGVLVIIVAGYLTIRYFANRSTPPEVIPTVDVQTTSSDLPTKHTVANGESLWAIAEKYYGTGYNWVDIKEANNLNNADQIHNGDELTIPAVTPRVALAQTGNKDEEKQAEQPKETKSETPTPQEPVSETPSITPQPKEEEKVETAESPSNPEQNGKYVVTSGDNLWKIAQKYYNNGDDWVKIAKANEIENPSVIRSGQELKIPDTNENVSQVNADNTSSTSTERYVVEKGDSLWNIAQATYNDGNKWPEIAKANNLSHPNIIHTGNTLTIPR